MTRADAVAEATQALAHLPSAKSEALSLLFAVESIDRVEWMMRPDNPITKVSRWTEALRRRQAGESLAAITGQAGFFDQTLAVGPGVLIPRPDSESFAQIQWGTGPVLDLGSGSGALAGWAYAQGHRPVLAVEYSCMALSYARRNLPIPVTLIRGNWSRSIAPGSIGTLLANPPYIDASEAELSGDGVCREPTEALVAQDQGFADLFWIAKDACRVLRAGGWLWMEHGYQQHERVAAEMQDLGYQSVQGIVDLAGHTRITGGQWNG